MALFAITFLVILLAVAGLSLGLLVGRGPPRGCSGGGKSCKGCSRKKF